MIRFLLRHAPAALLLLATNAPAAGLFASPNGGGREAFLPVEQAFQPQAAQDAGQLKLHWDIAPGHYLYDRQFRIRWRQPADGPALPEARRDREGEWHDDPTFGRVRVHRDSIDLALTAPAGLAASGAGELEVRYQGCADAGLCYPPQTWQVPVDFASWQVPAPATSANASTATTADSAPGLASDADSLSRWLATASLPMIVGAFLLLGLGLSFTPCVLPMLPILSAIIAGQQRQDARRGFLLALSYVLGMTFIYTLAGLLIAGLGAAANLSALMQRPAVLLPFAAAFVVFAVILLRGGDLRLPAFLAEPLTRLQQRQQGGQLISVFVMGAVSSLVVSPCVSAPLAGIMLFLASSQDMLLGGIALASLGFGMGLPLLLLGAGGGRFLPRSGPWLDAIKRLFGWMLLAVAVMLICRLLPMATQMLVWAGFIAISGLALMSLRPASAPARVATVSLALLALAWAGLMTWSAARGGSDALRPWLQPATAGASVKSGMRRISDPAELDRAIAEASAQGRPVIVDLYADWCVSCVEMDKHVLHQPDVQALLARGVALKFDITATTAEQLAWLQQRELFGPPAFLYWNAAGQARPTRQGEMNKETFMKTLEEAWN